MEGEVVQLFPSLVLLVGACGEGMGVAVAVYNAWYAVGCALVEQVDQVLGDLRFGDLPVPGREDYPGDVLVSCVPETYGQVFVCLLYTSPSPRDKRQSRMPSSA